LTRYFVLWLSESRPNPVLAVDILYCCAHLIVENAMPQDIHSGQNPFKFVGGSGLFSLLEKVSLVKADGLQPLSARIL
jgi:hypothetical protein